MRALGPEIVYRGKSKHFPGLRRLSRECEQLWCSRESLGFGEL